MSVENPSQRKDVLRSVTENMEYYDNVLFQVFFEPRESKDSEIRDIESEYSRAIENSETTVTVPHSGRESKSKRRVDVHAVRKAEQLKKKLDRLRNRYLCDVRVTSISWGSKKKTVRENALRPLDLLRGVIVPANEETDFSTRVKGSRKDFDRLMSGLPAGKKTTLTPFEALTYFLLPESDLGIQVAEQPEFHTNPQQLRSSEAPARTETTQNALNIGSILDDKDNPVRDLQILIDYFTKQGGIFGDTGSGKTTTVTRILYELYKKHIPFLVFLPSKNEDYRALVKIMPKVRVFTPADETIAALRLNPHISSEGVNVNKILSDTKAAYLAALPNIGMTKNYLEATFNMTYERLGWNRDTNEHGLPVLLSDLKETLPLVETTKLLYSDTMTEDFYGALNGRLDTLMDGPLNRVFTTLTGMTIAELVSEPTIILMDGLSDEEKALLNALLLVNIAHYLESLKNKSSARKGLKYVIVMEEAHNLLTGSSEGESTEEGHAARQHAINTLLRIMREGRSSGLGLLIVDQLPDLLAPTAVKIPKTMIVHNLSSISARNLVCDQINCTEGQKRQVGALAVGHAIVKLPDLAGPIRVSITPLTKEFPQLDGLFVTDEEIRTHMRPIYEKFPHFKDGVSIAMTKTGLDPRNIARLLQLSDLALFGRAFLKAVNNALKGMPRTLTFSIFELAQTITWGFGHIPIYCQYITWLLEKLRLITWEELSTSLLDNLKEHIRHHLDMDWSPDESLTKYFETVTAEARIYLQRTPPVADAIMKKELIDLFTAAREKRDAAITRPVAPAPEVSETSTRPAFDPEVDIFIQTVVETDQFSKMYFDRLRKAANGDTFPIVNMIVRFAKKLVGSGGLVADAAARFLEHSRSSLGAPEDPELWELISAKVGAAITE